jgi:hypothetical protein
MNNVDTKLNENELDNNIRIDIQFNVLTLLMLEKYNFVFESDFFKKMLEIYLNGHIPCGWKNNHFLVY